MADAFARSDSSDEDVMTLGLRHVALRCADLGAARRFYEEGLGFTFLGHRSTVEGMDLGDGATNLTLLAYDGPPRTALEEGAEFIHLGFLVDDAAATYHRLVGLGAPVVRDDVKRRDPHDPDSVPSGSFKVLDPDGNVLDISDVAQEWRSALPAR
jgi:catechol 2,3-dioxygenase-like lactoylglutathione lyase family enzyme